MILVVVIGAGAIGLSTALHLTELEIDDVVVIERDQVASGSSGLSVGIIETQYVDPLDIEVRVRSIEFFNRLARDHGLDVVRNGYLRLAHSKEHVATFNRSVEIQRELGIPDATVLSPREIKRLIPDMYCDDLAGGLFGPSDGYIDGHLYCGVLRKLAEAGGARVLAATAVTGAAKGARKVHRLTTTSGDLECDFVVNAAGAWAPAVGRLLETHVAILPQRHQAVVVQLGRELNYVMPSVMDYTPHTGGYGLYCRHEGSFQLIAGLHTEEPLHDVVDPDRYSRSADPDFLELVAEKLTMRLPGLADSRVAHGWAGLYPISPDGRPQVGPHRERPTVVSAAGGGGSGLQASPAIGRLAAEWIVFGEPRSIPGASSFLPGRESLQVEIERE